MTDLAFFFGAAHTDRVGAPDDFGLGPLPTLRLWITADGLYAGERVEGADERYVELVFEPVTGDARQPVVGVDEVGRLLVEVDGHAVGEHVAEGGGGLFREIEGTAVDVTDAEARLDGHFGRETVAPRASEDRAIAARLCQRGHELADIDVHASAVTGT